MLIFPNPSRDPSFNEFCERVVAKTRTDGLAERVGLSAPVVEARVRMAIGEAAQTMRLLAGVEVGDTARILEVGAGLGVASAYLSSLGFEVVALEPGGQGFSEHAVISRELVRILGAGYTMLAVGAETLRLGTHGQFDLILSNNVLEHVDNPVLVLRSLAEVLSDRGIMVHSCPNYSVPFEPHFGLPLVPGRPQWTSAVLPRSIRESEVWRSLNFIKARDVTRIIESLGLEVHFRAGSLAVSLERLGEDQEFSSRHRVLAKVAMGLRSVGLVSAVRRLPPSWATPMDFIVTRSGASEPLVTFWINRTATISS